MSADVPFEAATLEDLAARLLHQHPEAPMGAMNADAQFVPIPPSLAVAGHPVLSARTSFELVQPADLRLLVDAWDSARASGAGTARVHLARDGEPTSVHILDLCARHGVYLIVYVPDEGDGREAIVDAPSYLDPLPRLCTTWKNEVAVITAIDDAVTRLLGWPADEIVGRRSLEFVHPDDQHRAIDNWLQMLAAPDRGYRWRGRHLCRDGTFRWLEFTNTNHLGDPDRGHVLGEMADITDEMAAHEALRVREEMLLRLAEALPVGLVQFDAARRIVFTNEQLHGIVGAPRAATIDEQLATVLPGDRARLDALIAATLGGDDVGDEIEVRLARPGEAEPCVCQLSLRHLTDEAGQVTGVIGCLSDVTERVRLRSALEARATFDALTGCHNRAATMARLQDLLERDPAATIGVVFVDLDRFKAINDELGHVVGDEVLRIVGARLRAAVRGRDVVGRIGGDEFLVICTGVEGPRAAVEVAERLCRAVAERLEAHGRTFDLQASVGVAVGAASDVRGDALVARADAAMYESKRAGLGRPVLA